MTSHYADHGSEPAIPHCAICREPQPGITWHCLFDDVHNPIGRPHCMRCGGGRPHARVTFAPVGAPRAGISLTLAGRIVADAMRHQRRVAP